MRDNKGRYKKSHLLGFKKGYIPWNKGKKTGPLSEELKKKISKAVKGFKHTKLSKQKMSLARKGKKGHKQTIETRQKISAANKGHKVSRSTRLKIIKKLTGNIPYNKGKKASKQTRIRLRISHLGQAAWNKGKGKKKIKKKFNWKRFYKKQSKRVKVFWSNKQYRNNMVKKHTGYKVTDETKRKLAITMTNQILDGKRNFGGRGNIGFRKDLKIFVRSSLEANYIRILKYRKIPFQYEKKRFELSDGTVYVPDIYLPRTNEYIEIKGGNLKVGWKKKYDKFIKAYPRIKWRVLYQSSKEWTTLDRKYSKIIETWEFYKGRKRPRP